jgi:hypothetical protein
MLHPWQTYTQRTYTPIRFGGQTKLSTKYTLLQKPGIPKASPIQTVRLMTGYPNKQTNN